MSKYELHVFFSSLFPPQMNWYKMEFTTGFCFSTLDFIWPITVPGFIVLKKKKKSQQNIVVLKFCKIINITWDE